MRHADHRVRVLLATIVACLIAFSGVTQATVAASGLANQTTSFLNQDSDVPLIGDGGLIDLDLDLDADVTVGETAPDTLLVDADVDLTVGDPTGGASGEGALIDANVPVEADVTGGETGQDTSLVDANVDTTIDVVVADTGDGGSLVDANVPVEADVDATVGEPNEGNSLVDIDATVEADVTIGETGDGTSLVDADVTADADVEILNSDDGSLIDADATVDADVTIGETNDETALVNTQIDAAVDAIITGAQPNPASPALAATEIPVGNTPVINPLFNGTRLLDLDLGLCLQLSVLGSTGNCAPTSQDSGSEAESNPDLLGLDADLCLGVAILGSTGDCVLTEDDDDDDDGLIDVDVDACLNVAILGNADSSAAAVETPVVTPTTPSGTETPVVTPTTPAGTETPIVTPTDPSGTEKPVVIPTVPGGGMDGGNPNETSRFVLEVVVNPATSLKAGPMATTAVNNLPATGSGTATVNDQLTQGMQVLIATLIAFALCAVAAAITLRQTYPTAPATTGSSHQGGHPPTRTNTRRFSFSILRKARRITGRFTGHPAAPARRTVRTRRTFS